MKYQLFVLVLCISAAKSVDHHDESPCTDDSQPGDICSLQVADVLPTQFAVGMLEVQCKIGKYESLSPNELEKYLKSHLAPMVVGPDGFYITDRHHMAKALFDSDIDDTEKVMWLNVTDNYANSALETFWQEMVDNGQVWLYDQKGVQPMTPWYLPKSWDAMIDDPFRSLAWMLRNSGGYGKVDTDYSDFMWTNFLRDNIVLTQTKKTAKLDPSSWTWCQVSPYSPLCIEDLDSELQKVLPQAITLSQSAAASGLPGYDEGTPEPADCGNSTSPYISV